MISSTTHISSLEIPALEPFRTLRRPIDHLRRGIFVAESEKVSLRLLESDIEPISMLLSPAWFEKYNTVIERHRTPIDLFIGNASLLESIVGHRLHQSIMVLAKVPRQLTMEELLSKKSSGRFYVMLDGITNAENMGVIVRNCASFNVDAVIILPSSCDPYLRRSVRNSMGSIFRMPVVYVSEIDRDFDLLKKNGVTMYASSLDTRSLPIHTISFSEPLCIVFGSEGEGISHNILERSETLVTIPMNKEVDSLNVASASAVLLYEVSRSLRIGKNH